MYIDANVMEMLEAYKGLDYVVVYVEKGVDPIMVLSSNVDDIGNDSDDITGVAEGEDQRCTTGQLSQPASTLTLAPTPTPTLTPTPTPTPSTNIPSNEMSSNIQTRKGGQVASQPPMSTASIGLKRRNTRSFTQPTKLPTHGGKASSGLGKGPEITVGGRGRGRGPINAFASAVNVGRIGVNANVREHAVSVTSILETIKARRLHKELATGSK
ncbi:hypothetical protein LOK49_LG07G00602 [Camellia lanceoleosa]|uniref:Uncharacterized protein n=1 Tax=Camellia lanceoleosa TaxID=1840588 RepID=A0ACC0H0E6_9ERIC|nr:hypothetical protein LOK49_LG07G00602 [Camellia lanceoleosa]